jgi:hypothetical protein
VRPLQHDEDHRGVVALIHVEDQANDEDDREREAGARQHWPTVPVVPGVSGPMNELKRAAVVLWGGAAKAVDIPGAEHGADPSKELVAERACPSCTNCRRTHRKRPSKPPTRASSKTPSRQSVGDEQGAGVLVDARAAAVGEDALSAAVWPSDDLLSRRHDDHADSVWR